MIAVGAVALAAFVVYLLVRVARHSRAVQTGATGGAPDSATVSPSALRLLGLLALLLALLVLYWRWLDDAAGYAAMVYAIYPASIALVLVLIFDKATRSWSYKGALAGLREWLFCDTLVFLLFLAWVNLWMSAAGAGYRAFFWDALGLVLSVLVFWLVDRKLTRFRFLTAYAFLLALPILLLIWATVQDVPAQLGIAQRERALPAERAAPAEEVAVMDGQGSAASATAQSGDAEDVYTPQAMAESQASAGGADGEGDVFSPQAMSAAQGPTQAEAQPGGAEEGDVFSPQAMAAAQGGRGDLGGEPANAPPGVEAPAPGSQAALTPAAPVPPAMEPATPAALEPTRRVSWWASIWPFFAWTGAFLVLEIIGLIALADSDQSILLLLKDVAFVVGYAVLLLVAAA